MEESKRLFIGGLFDNVTERDLKERFAHFGSVSEIEIRKKRDEAGNPIKTFAYVNINITSEKIKSCMKALNCTKWRSHEMKIEIAKPSFYLNLLKDIAEQKKEPLVKKSVEMELTGSDVKCFNKVFHNAKLGSEVPNKKDWVIVKYGQALPIMRMRHRNRKKIITVNPSKFYYNHKRFASNDIYFDQTKRKFPNNHKAAGDKTKKNMNIKQFKNKFTPKDYHDIRSVPASVSTDYNNKKRVAPDTTTRDSDCTGSNIISKKLKSSASNSKDCANKVSSSDSLTKDSVKPNKTISQKNKSNDTKTTSVHKGQHLDPEKAKTPQKSQEITKPVKTSTMVERKTYVNSKVLQKFLSTKGSRGLVLRAKPSLLLKYKSIASVGLKS